MQIGTQDGLAYLIVNAESLIGVLDKLVNGEGGVVWLDNGVGDLWRWNDGEGRHHAVGELLADLRNEKGSHASTSTTTQRVRDLEALEAVTALSLTTNDIQHLVDKLGALGVVALGPVVAGARLAEDEVVGTEQATERTSTYGIHGAWFKVDKNGAGDILVGTSLEKN